MTPEVSDRHLAAQDKGHRPCKETENQKWSTDNLQHRGKPEQREGDNLVTVHTAEGPEFLRAMKRKGEGRNNTKDRQDVTGQRGRFRRSSHDRI